MISVPLIFLEGIVKSIGIDNVIKEAAQQKQIARRPYCHLIPQKGTITKDWTRVRKDVNDPGEPYGGSVTHHIRKWIVENPVRVIFAAGKDCEMYGVYFLAALPKGFKHEGQWIEVDVIAELPPLDESLLYDAGEIAYDVVFRSGIFTRNDVPMFRDSIVKGKIDHGETAEH
jgi:hypothetical protein